MTGPRLTGNRCQCPTCGDYFGSVRGFDRHRVGTVGAPDRRCMTGAEMLATGWQRNARGFLLTPDPRRTGAGIAAPRIAPPATGVAGVVR
ncbi:FDXHR family putative zinc-binding protein [Lysobacter sp. P5_B9]